MKSLQASLTFDFNGNPSFNLGLGDIQSPDATLDEIFHYLEQANKPCIVAIDEFQQITNYAEDNVKLSCALTCNIATMPISSLPEARGTLWAIYF